MSVPLRTPLIYALLLAFIASGIHLPDAYAAGDILLPKPGVRVGLSPEFNPVILKGITVDPNNPFKFDFVLSQGDSTSPGAQKAVEVYLKKESTKLVKYFLSSITTPEKDLWVNLSPYEKDRIIPDSFGQTDMGRDLLAQDYLLKQITASLIYPEEELGKKFWKRVYEKATKKFGTTDIPVNMFNKVWIVPDKAKVYEHGNTAYVVNARLKVMLEEDYLAGSKSNQTSTGPAASVSPSSSLQFRATGSPSFASPVDDANNLGSQIIREVVIPQLEREVNEGKNFAPLRQVYNSLVLAVWFKQRMKDSILGRKYMDQNKILGIQRQPGDMFHQEQPKNVSPSRLPSNIALNVRASEGNKQDDVEVIYQQYLQAFKKGVYNYIKEEPDPTTQQPIARKYFSGGFSMDRAMSTTEIVKVISPSEANLTNGVMLTVNLATFDQAMRVKEKVVDKPIKLLVNTTDSDWNDVGPQRSVKWIRFIINDDINSFRTWINGHVSEADEVVILPYDNINIIRGKKKEALALLTQRYGSRLAYRYVSVSETATTNGYKRFSFLIHEDTQGNWPLNGRARQVIHRTPVENVLDIINHGLYLLPTRYAFMHPETLAQYEKHINAEESSFNLVFRIPANVLFADSDEDGSVFYDYLLRSDLINRKLPPILKEKLSRQFSGQIPDYIDGKDMKNRDYLMLLAEETGFLSNVPAQYIDVKASLKQLEVWHKSNVNQEELYLAIKQALLGLNDNAQKSQADQAMKAIAQQDLKRMYWDEVKDYIGGLVQQVRKGEVINRDSLSEIAGKLAKRYDSSGSTNNEDRLRQRMIGAEQEGRLQLNLAVVLSAFVAQQVMSNDDGVEYTNVYLPRDMGLGYTIEKTLASLNGKEQEPSLYYISRDSLDYSVYQTISNIIDRVMNSSVRVRKELGLTVEQQRQYFLEEVGKEILNDATTAQAAKQIKQELKELGLIKSNAALRFVDTGFKTFPIMLQAIIAADEELKALNIKTDGVVISSSIKKFLPELNTKEWDQQSQQLAQQKRFKAIAESGGLLGLLENTVSLPHPFRYSESQGRMVETDPQMQREAYATQVMFGYGAIDYYQLVNGLAASFEEQGLTQGQAKEAAPLVIGELLGLPGKTQVDFLGQMVREIDLKVNLTTVNFKDEMQLRWGKVEDILKYYKPEFEISKIDHVLFTKVIQISQDKFELDKNIFLDVVKAMPMNLNLNQTGPFDSLMQLLSQNIQSNIKIEPKLLGWKPVELMKQFSFKDDFEIKNINIQPLKIEVGEIKNIQFFDLKTTLGLWITLQTLEDSLPPAVGNDKKVQLLIERALRGDQKARQALVKLGIKTSEVDLWALAIEDMSKASDQAMVSSKRQEAAWAIQETLREKFNNTIDEKESTVYRKAIDNFLTMYDNTRDYTDQTIELIEQFINTPGIERVINKLAIGSSINKLGAFEELYHASLFTKAGYKMESFEVIIDNESGNALEIDMLASRNGEYYFIEVKHFTSASSQSPGDLINRIRTQTTLGKIKQYKQFFETLKSAGERSLAFQSFRERTKSNVASQLLTKIRNDQAYKPKVLFSVSVVFNEEKPQQFKQAYITSLAENSSLFMDGVNAGIQPIVTARIFSANNNQQGESQIVTGDVKKQLMPLGNARTLKDDLDRLSDTSHFVYARVKYQTENGQIQTMADSFNKVDLNFKGEGKDVLVLNSNKVDVAKVQELEVVSLPKSDNAQLSHTDQAMNTQKSEVEALIKAGEQASQHLLHPWFVKYNASLRRIVNPFDHDITIAYGGAAGDISNAILSTGFTKAYWIDRQLISRDRLEEAFSSWNELRNNDSYLEEKFLMGYSSAHMVKDNIEVALMYELKAMGVKQKDINISGRYAIGEDLVLSFYLPSDNKKREIIFASRDLRNMREDFVKSLVGKLDVYYDKASMNLLRDYPELMSIVIQWIKPGGFLMINNSDTDDNILDYQKLLDPTFRNLSKEDSEILKLKRQRTVGRKHYGWEMDIWQRPTVGGIDLTADRMNLDIDRDPNTTNQPMGLTVLDSIEINGLYIKSIELKPLTNLLQLLGL